jgi:hypothetical protein
MLTVRRERADARFRVVLLRWLAKLPVAGWEGTSHELGQELAAFAERHRLIVFVPTCPGRAVAKLAGFLADNGFTISHNRTSTARTVRFAATRV